MEQVVKTPCDVESELATLGCVFLEPSIFETVNSILQPDDFYEPKNRLIFKAMLDLFNESQVIDPTTVTSYLEKMSILDQAGGIEYISSIAMRGYSTDNVENYADLVLQASIRRKTIAKLNDLSQAGYDANVNTFDYLDVVEKEIFELSKKRNVDALTHISKVSQEVLENTERNAQRNQDVIGLYTGFSNLDRVTQGFQNDTLIILAARPAMGKSAFALNLALNVAEKNKGGKASVAVFNLEMSSASQVERLVASEASIPLSQIKTGQINKTDWVRFNTACSKLSYLDIYFDDSSDVNVSKIKAKCRKLKESSGLDFIVIDYLQLIEPDNSSQKASQVEKITKISRNLKLMARDLHVPVLALSQLSRKVEEREGDKIPNMSDLRDSGSIEQDADIVMFLYRDDYYKKKTSKYPGEAELIIAKNRSGATANIYFDFRSEHQKFIAKQREEAMINND
ncbi:MAG: replicative DNA helicase [Acholeplasmatales bacterium]|nr:replicative DNA helicase [Acholeplasmatales bacterium]